MPSPFNLASSFGVPSPPSSCSSKASSCSKASGGLSDIELASRFLPFLLSPSPSDVLFICQRPPAGSLDGQPSQLWASKALLARGSGYFAALFSGEWSESAELEEGREGGKELWVEAPEGLEVYGDGVVCEKFVVTTSAQQPDGPAPSSVFTIRTSIPVPLLQAVLLYLYTSHISFLDSLHSSPLSPSPNSTAPTLPPPVPPLPIYLLAEYFDIPSLQSLALDAYSSFLLSSLRQAILSGLFDTTIALHLELQELVLGIASSAEIWVELQGEWTEGSREQLGVEEDRWEDVWGEVERRVEMREEQEKRAVEDREREETRKREAAQESGPSSWRFGWLEVAWEAICHASG